MLNLAITLSLQLLTCILFGYLVNKFVPHNAKINKIIDDTILYCLNPLLIFYSLWRMNEEIEVIAIIKFLSIPIIVVIFSTLVAFVYSNVQNKEFRDVCLPIIFMNSGYLAIPINTILFNVEGLAYANIYSIVVGVLQFTYGIYLVSHKGGVQLRIKGLKITLWFLLFVFIGLVFNILNVEADKKVVTFFAILSKCVIYVLLAYIGYEIGAIKGKFDVLEGGTVIALRMFSGMFIAVVLTHILCLSGALRGVAIISSSMPSAVTNYIIAEKFGCDKKLASEAIVGGTLAAFILIPLIVYVLRLR